MMLMLLAKFEFDTWFHLKNNNNNNNINNKELSKNRISPKT